MANNWEELPMEIMVIIVQKLSCMEDFLKLSTICKLWKSHISKLYEDEKPLLPLRRPILLLAEEVAEGAIVDHNEEEDDSSSKDDGEEDDSSSEDDGEEEDDGNGADSEEDEDKDDDNCRIKYDHSKNSVGNSRDYYSVSSDKTYNMDLPEAAGRLILGTNKGCLITLGRDLQINLLHPFLRKQIPLPPMLTLPIQYDDTFSPEEVYDNFIKKVVISSVIPAKSQILHNHESKDAVIVMAIYGECGYLAFTRLGDKVWTEITVPTKAFDDIVYHKETFYAIDCHGDVYVCDIQQRRGTKISSITKTETYKDGDQKYLVESSSGYHLFVVVRSRKTNLPKYQTTGFTVWKLEFECFDSSHIPSWTFGKNAMTWGMSQYLLATIHLYLYHVPTK